MTNLDGVFRREWGPAVAALARWSGDLTVAEDAVQEACAEALRSLASRRGARQPRRVAGDRRPQSRPGSATSRIRPSRKGIGGCGGRYPGPHRSHRPASGARRRAADDVHLRAPGAGPAVATGAHAAAGVRVDGRRDRPRAAADRGGRRPANHPRQEQDSARQHPAAGAARRAAARAHAARAQLHLLGVHRGLLVDRGPLGDSRRTVRRGGPAGRRAVRADAARAGGARLGSPCAAA